MTAAVVAHTEAPTDPAAGLRVLAFCDHYDPAGGGGAERVAAEVYRRLADRGTHITVVTTAGHAPDAWRHGRLRIVRVPTLDLTRALGLQATLTWGATRAAARLVAAARPHVLHANSLQFQTSVAAARVARRSGVPLVLTAHIAGFESLARPWRSVAQLHERTVGRFVTRRSDRVIAVSDGVARHLTTRVRSATPVRVVPNGVDHDTFHPGTAAQGRRPVHLLFVGRLVANKGPDRLVDAFAALRARRDDVHLTIIGDGPLRGPLERRVRERGVADTVAFLGFRRDVADHLRAADVLVRPSLTEGMPLALLEAMATRLCIVASDVPGNAALIHHDDTGLLVRPDDARALETALERVVADRRLRQRLAAAAHVRAGRFSWDRCAQQTLDVLLDVASAGHPTIESEEPPWPFVSA